MTDTHIRKAIVAACRRMVALGITQGTSGNISVRCGARMLISPSAIPYDEMQPAQIADLAIEGDPDPCGDTPPSTEWRLHRGILRARPDCDAVVHGHPIHATALSMLRQDIPACHYMVAAFGGESIRCTPYATYGSAALAELAVIALHDRYGCLLGNHGSVVCAPTLPRALWLASELETLSRQYCQARQIGTPILLSAAEISETVAKLGSYGVR